MTIEHDIDAIADVSADHGGQVWRSTQLRAAGDDEDVQKNARHLRSPSNSGLLMISRNFDWQTGRVVFWDLDPIDEFQPLADQTEHLKEDLAQIEYPADVILDVGWYPEFGATGNFVVCVVQQGEWERPAFQKDAFTTEGLKGSIVEGIQIAAELAVQAGPEMRAGRD